MVQPGCVARLGDFVYFVGHASGSGGGNVSLYRAGISSGTGAARISDLPTGGVSNFTAGNLVATGSGGLYLDSSTGKGDATLWAVDGATGASPAARAVADLQPLNSTYVPQGFASLGSAAVFVNYDAATGWEVWRSGGTSGGTGPVADVCPDTLPSRPSYPAAFGGRALFVADDGVHGAEPWVSDGTAAGTRMLKDIVPGAGGSDSWQYATQFAAAGDRAFFVATDPTTGAALWVTDGSEAGTRLVRDVRGR